VTDNINLNDMKLFKVFIPLVLTGFLVMNFLPAGSQFVTLARKIKTKMSGNSEESTVVLDARTDKVYHALVDTVSTAPKIKIIRQDDKKRTVEFTSGSNTVSMKVDSLAEKLCKITVTATDSGQSSSSSPSSAVGVTVKAINAVCKKLGIQCTVEEH
jgi:hypothetical protein